MLLFAEEPGVTGAIWAGVGSIATVIVGAIVSAYLTVSKNRREGKKEDRKDTITEWSQLADRLSADLKDARRDIDIIKKELTESFEREGECRERQVRAESKIESLQEALTNAGIKFRPYDPDYNTGSKVHPLPPAV